MTEAILKKVSGVQTPEGIAAEIAMPSFTSLKGMKKVIALDEVNDPGNLGTLIRTALALGWEGAYLLNNSCDPYNDKALRAAKGATFRLPLQRGNWKELEQLITLNQLDPIVADIDGTPIENVTAKERILLVLSNEAKGPSVEAKQICSTVTIPMPGPMESLNVSTAGAILMYTLNSTLQE